MGMLLNPICRAGQWILNVSHCCISGASVKNTGTERLLGQCACWACAHATVRILHHLQNSRFMAGSMVRGSQRARDILKAMGEEAFHWFPITTGYGPKGHTRNQRPLSGRQIAQLKREHLMSGEYALPPDTCTVARRRVQVPV
jgi:hypothetical protein